MNEREKEIAYIAASAAAGCVPCLRHHKQKGLLVGLTQDDIFRIARYAFVIRRKADEFNVGSLDTVLTGDDLSHTESNRSVSVNT